MELRPHGLGSHFSGSVSVPCWLPVLTTPSPRCEGPGESGLPCVAAPGASGPVPAKAGRPGPGREGPGGALSGAGRSTASQGSSGFHLSCSSRQPAKRPCTWEAGREGGGGALSSILSPCSAALGERFGWGSVAVPREGPRVLGPTLLLVPSVRRQFPPSPSAPKIPSWQIPVKSPSPSSPAAANHHSSSDISPVSNESTSSSPVKEGHGPEGSTATYHLLGPQEEGQGLVDVKGQVRMEVQGEEEKREDEEDEEDEDVSHVDEEGCLGVQREDRRGGDGQINEQVEKLRRPEGASNENERD